MAVMQEDADALLGYVIRDQERRQAERNAEVLRAPRRPNEPDNYLQHRNKREQRLQAEAQGERRFVDFAIRGVSRIQEARFEQGREVIYSVLFHDGSRAGISGEDIDEIPHLAAAIRAFWEENARVRAKNQNKDFAFKIVNVDAECVCTQVSNKPIDVKK